MKMLQLNAFLLLVVLTLLPVNSFASGQRGQRGQGRPQGPPSEAIEACQDKSAGDSVTFKGRRGETIEATCQERDGQLAAVPNDAPERGGRP